MKKVFISWMATINDFDESGRKTKKSGPNYRFHKHHYEANEYEAHYLLCSDSTSDIAADQSTIATNFMTLKSSIQMDFNTHKLEPKFLGLNSKSKDLPSVLASCRKLLMDIDAEQFDISITSGHRMMGLAWLIIHYENTSWNTRLMQVGKEKSDGSALPLIDLVISQSAENNQIVVRAAGANKQNHGERVVTPLLKKVYEEAQNAATLTSNKVTFLISGPTGSGKEYLANLIRESSPERSDGSKFFAINCGGFDGSDTLRSELFGHKKGAFTGAEKNKDGLFKKADGGLLFLDEVHNMSKSMQRLLLRALEDGEIHPIGGDPQKVDVQVIFGTNVSLLEKVEAGEFLLDLYFRISTYEITLPGLNEYPKKDMLTMLDGIKEKVEKLLGNKFKISLSKALEKRMLVYSWPGNIRELESIMIRLYAGGGESNEKIERYFDTPQIIGSSSLIREDVLKEYYHRIYHHFEGNKSLMRKVSGDSHPTTLNNKLKKYGVVPSEYKKG